MTDEPINPEVLDPIDNPARDARGRILPGHSGNPKGRPKKVDLLSIINEELKKIDNPLDKKTKAQKLIEVMLKQAIDEGDRFTQKLIWNYQQGMPKIAIEHDVKQPTPLLSNLIPYVPDNNSDTEALEAHQED